MVSANSAGTDRIESLFGEINDSAYWSSSSRYRRQPRRHADRRRGNRALLSLPSRRGHKTQNELPLSPRRPGRAASRPARHPLAAPAPVAAAQLAAETMPWGSHAHSSGR